MYDISKYAGIPERELLLAIQDDPKVDIVAVVI